MNDIDTLKDLQTIVIFGIASLFLYLVVPVALFANEVRLAKRSDDTSGTAAIFNSLVQAFYFIIAWSIFVSIIFFLVIKVVNKGETNPAVGIDRYWQAEWIKVDENGSTVGSQGILNKSEFEAISTSEDGPKRTQAKLLILIITWAKALEMLLLGVLLALTLKLSMSLPLLKMRRADHYKMSSGIDIGTMMSIFMTGILGWVVFIGILNFEALLLNALIEAGPTPNSGSTHFSYITTTTKPVDLLNGLKDLLESGMNRLSP